MRNLLAVAILAAFPAAALPSPARMAARPVPAEWMSVQIAFLDASKTPLKFWIDGQLAFDGTIYSRTPSYGLTFSLNVDLASGMHRFRVLGGKHDVSRTLRVAGNKHIVVVSGVPGRELEVTDRLLLD